jgi:CheY-like chemotaxis protein
LDTLIHNGLNKHRQQANEKGLKFELQLPDAKEEVLGDPDRLQQMIHELVENSLEFTKEGKVSVSVMVNEPSSNELKIRVEVKDTGCGIEQSKADVIFQQFSQVDMSNTRKFSGIGLGLSLCRKLAILMGGKIGVQSEEGKGSRFWFDVMLKKVEIENQIHCQDNGVDLSERFSKMIALVVDDNAISRRVMVKALSAFGFEVEVTGSGYAALELLKTQDYNLAILDLSMHDLNGIEIANLLREGDGQLPVLFGIARKSDATTLERCLDAGMKGVIKKPLDPKKLKRLLVQVLI